MWKNKTIRYSALTIAFYTFLFGLSISLGHLFPDGPCGPGIADMVIIFSPVLILPLFVTSLVFILRGHRHQLGPLLVHVSAVTGFIVFYL